MLSAIAKPHGGEHLLCALRPLVAPPPRIDKRQSDIVECRDARQQVEVLKDEPNLLVARHGKRIVV